MKVSELIALLQAMPQDLTVKAQDGGICSDWEPVSDVELYTGTKAWDKETYVKLWSY